MQTTAAHDIESLHHVGLIVSDLDEAIGLYRRLGFSTTAQSELFVAAAIDEQPRPLGSANAMATFSRNFIELGAHVRSDIPDHLISPWLSRFPGFHILAFNTPSAEAVTYRLSTLGVSNGGVSTLQQEIETDDGPRTIRIRNVIFGGEDAGGHLVAWAVAPMPEGGTQAVQTLTPEYLYQKRNMDHANGAVDLVESVLCVEDAELPAIERRYEKYLGRPASSCNGTRRFELDHCRVTLVPASNLGRVLPGERPPALPAFLACGVAVRDLASTRSLLLERGFPLVDIEQSRFLIPADDALGGALIFSPAG